MKQFQTITMLCILILLYKSEIVAQQNYCGTIPTKEEYSRYFEDLKVMKERPERRIYEDNTIRVIMYRLRFDDGSGARSDSAFAEEINHLNTVYNAHDVCFSLMRVVNIDNSSLANADWQNDYDSLQSAIASQYPSFSDAATIYVLPQYLNPSTKGRAYGIPSTAFCMVSHEDWWGTGLAAHEMGHCLGLFHTHETNDNTNIELVTRTWGASCFNGQGQWHDCNVGGDGLCDTEAAFNFNFSPGWVDPSTCTYNFDPAKVDCQGNPYTPAGNNIMSYAPQTCLTAMSGQQVGKMHLTLDAAIIFDNKQAHLDYYLSGQTYNSGYSHYLAKNSIVVSDGSPFQALGSSQVLHEAQDFVDLKPGFVGSPTDPQGFYVARAKDLCNNSTTLDYSINED